MPCTPATTTHGVATAGSYCCGGAASSGHHGSRFLGGFACLSPSNIPTKGIEPNRSVTDETSEEITFRVVEVARRKEVDNSAGVDYRELTDRSEDLKLFISSLCEDFV
ncbi:uncharacterized protein LOC126788436 [Argentina anserina]|uniref:uncharacterized protein LOC126788436 n=1 Tax=Argentina anserina TaxID=57926 RepID=UPI00217629CA|nr:uncharacterized protein LOC126788436 [Potentilla anserina]